MTVDYNVTTHSFTDCSALAVALARRVAERLGAAIDARGHALLAVSGGTTPLDFFDALSRIELDWTQVRVTLVDERWVDETSERSNARLVRARLLQHAAAAATFVPLYTGAAGPDEGAAEVAANVAALPLPFDVVVLGMGADGHTASFLPGGDHLAEALDPDGETLVWPMHAPGLEPRITLSLSLLLRARALFLHFEGEAKRKVFDDARHGLGDASHYPIRAVLTQTRLPVAVYWCP